MQMELMIMERPTPIYSYAVETEIQIHPHKIHAK